MARVSPVSLAVGSFLIAAAGFAAGWLSGSRDAPSNGPGRTSPPATSPRENEPAGTSPRSTGTARAGETADADPAWLAAALGDGPDLARVAGTGVIQGRVVTEDGPPLAGVRVVALPRAPRELEKGWFDPATDPETSLAEVVRRSARLNRWLLAARRVAFTDDDGRYRLEGLPAEFHNVRPQSDGWQITVVRGKSPYVLPDATLDFTARAERRLALMATLPDGRPVSQATLRPAGEDRTWGGVTWAPQVDVLRVPTTVTAFRVFGGDDEMYRSEVVELPAFRPGEGILPVDVVLRGRAGVYGTVVPHHEEPWPYMVMALAAMPGDPPDGGDWIRDRAIKSVGVRPVDDPRFRFHDLPPGRYAIAAHPQGQPVLAWREVTVADGPVVVELPLNAVSREIAFHLLATDSDGKHVEVTSVIVGYAAGMSSGSSGGLFLRCTDGGYLVMSPDGFPRRPDEAAGLKCWMDVEARGLGSKRVEFQPGKNVEIRVAFSAPAKLIVSLPLEGTGFDPSNCFVEVAREEAGHGRVPGTSGKSPDSSGRVELENVQCGPAILRVNVVSPTTRGTLLRQAIDVRPGLQEVTAKIPRTAPFTVRGAQGRVNAYLFATGERGAFWASNATAGEDGVARFDALPSGKYQIQCLGRRAAVIVVPDMSEVTLEAE